MIMLGVFVVAACGVVYSSHRLHHLFLLTERHLKETRDQAVALVERLPPRDQEVAVQEMRELLRRQRHELETLRDHKLFPLTWEWK